MNIFQKYLAKPTAKAIQTKPLRTIRSTEKPKWFFLSDAKWDEYLNGDTATKHLILKEMWENEQLPF